MSKNRIAIVEGYRTPMGKMGGSLAPLAADQIGAQIFREIYERFSDYDAEISEVIIGNVAQPAHAANIARVIALRAGVPRSVPAFTVHRNCASGMEAVTSAISKIQAGHAEIILAGGVESMSNIPLLFPGEMKLFLEQLARSRSAAAKLKQLSKFKLKYLKPVIGLKLGLTDPVCNMIMGNTAEVLAQDFSISRKDQDLFAMQSHNRAEQATEQGIFQEEIIPFPVGTKKVSMLAADEGIRKGQNMQALTKLKPFFDRRNGTVTAGNSSQITDGGAALLVMSEKKAKEIGAKPLGYIKDFSYAGLDPARMGLGPAYAIAQLVKKHKLKIRDIDLFEINEAFAVQVLACVQALNSKKYCTESLGLKDKFGEIANDKLNVNGGAIALGHPVGMSGTRIIIHLLRELKRRKLKRGVASLCIGGGQGGAVLLEVN